MKKFFILIAIMGMLIFPFYSVKKGNTVEISCPIIRRGGDCDLCPEA